MARPRLKPTAEQRHTVKSMSAYGISQEDIARFMGIRSAKTLRRHYREELDRGRTEANVQVAQSLYKMAVSGGNPLAAIFWLKSRAGWRDQQPIESRVGVPPFIVSVEENR